MRRSLTTVVEELLSLVVEPTAVTPKKKELSPGAVSIWIWGGLVFCCSRSAISPNPWDVEFRGSISWLGATSGDKAG